jgi:N-carbamoylputrescine amidase
MMGMPLKQNSSGKFRVGLVQMSCSPDPKVNLEKAAERTRQAAKSGAQIVCLQEMYRSQYFCREERAELFDLAETVPGPSSKAFSKIAKEHSIVIVVPIFEKRATGLHHNSAIVIDADGTQLGLYRKMHIPDDPLFFEKFYFTPGDLGFKNFDTRFGRIAVLICWDQWYPEAARLTALRGAQILFYPTAIGWHPKEKGPLGATQHGRPSSARTPLPMASMWPPRIAWALKAQRSRIRKIAGWSFGAPASSAIRSAA